MNIKIYSYIIIPLILFLGSCASSKKKIDDPDLLYRIGEDYLKKGAFVQALSALFDAEKIDSKNHEIKNLIGFTFMVRGDFENAEKYYKKAISVKKDYSEAHVGLADVYTKTKRWEKAIYHADQALSNILYSAPFEAYNIRGWANYNRGDINSAEKDFKNALATNPNFVVAIYNLGLVYEKKSLFSEAANQYLLAVELCSKCPLNFLSDLHFRCGEAISKTDNKDDAIEHYKKCWELDPKYMNAEKCRSKSNG